MNCLICENESRGRHFGIRCCRACAAFFRRTIALNYKYKCRFVNDCNVTLNKRYSCRACRFEKCLKIGMSKEMMQHNEPTSSEGEAEFALNSPSEQNSSNSSEEVLEREVSPQASTINYNVGNTSQPNIQFHRSVIEEVGKAVMPALNNKDNGNHIEQDLQNSYHNAQQYPTSNNAGVQNQIFLMAAQQATKDLHVNVQNILTPAIDNLFSQPSSNFCQMVDIPLTLCQQALFAYREHNRQWPNQDRLVENMPLDMDLFMRNHYIEIEHIARFCMSIRVFSELPKDQKWIIFKHFWTRFYELDRCFATCKRLGYNIHDERGITLDGQVINFGISVVKLEYISDMDASQVKNFLKGSMDKFRLIFINPFKKLQPTEYELMYMMMSIMWSVANLNGISETTKAIAEKVEMRLAEDLHNYYIEKMDNNNPNYAGRITRLSSIASAVDEITERKREDSQVSKTFNIFKNDIFFSDLTDFPV